MVVGNSAISDLKLLEIYCKAKLVILPLLNTLQPQTERISPGNVCRYTCHISLTDGFGILISFQISKI